MRLNIFETTLDGAPFMSEAEEKLRFLAASRYGADNVESVLLAWELFSNSLCDHFPYSAGVCRYPGPLQAAPAQPFFLDKSKPVPRTSARFNAVDLDWAHKSEYNTSDVRWDPALVRGCFERFSAMYREGIAVFDRLGNNIPSEGVSIARMQSLMADSMVHFIDFCELREKLDSQPDRSVWVKLLDVCLAEKDTAAKALELARGNSFIGFSCEGQGGVRGGYFTPETIEEKLHYLEETISEIQTHL